MQSRLVALAAHLAFEKAQRHRVVVDAGKALGRVSRQTQRPRHAAGRYGALGEAAFQRLPAIRRLAAGVEADHAAVLADPENPVVRQVAVDVGDVCHRHVDGIGRHRLVAAVDRLAHRRDRTLAQRAAGALAAGAAAHTARHAGGVGILVGVVVVDKVRAGGRRLGRNRRLPLLVNLAQHVGERLQFGRAGIGRATGARLDMVEEP